MATRAAAVRRARARPRSSPDTHSAEAAAPRGAEVVLDVEVEHGRVHLVLANCGVAVATEIEVAFSRPLRGLAGTLDVSALPVFKRLGVLRPGRTLRVFWDSVATLCARDQATEPFVALVEWSERAAGRQRAKYSHDLSIYRVWPECVDDE